MGDSSLRSGRSADCSAVVESDRLPYEITGARDRVGVRSLYMSISNENSEMTEVGASAAASKPICVQLSVGVHATICAGVEFVGTSAQTRARTRHVFTNCVDSTCERVPDLRAQKVIFMTIGSNVVRLKNCVDFILRSGRSCSAAFFLLLISSSFFATHAQSASHSALPDGRGKKTVLAKCTQCHGPETFASTRKSADGWDQLLTKMTSNGLTLTDEEYDVILDYLTKNLGPTPAKINVNKASADELQRALEITGKEAQAIVKYRGAHGDFRSWQEIAKVEGVDAKKIEAKKSAIAF